MVKVVKFGGSSLADAEQFKKVAAIIKAEDTRRYVVASAPGKRFDEDIKVTDMLYKCADAVQEKDFATFEEQQESLKKEIDESGNKWILLPGPADEFS